MDPSFDIDAILLKYVRGEELSVEETILLHQWLAADDREALLQQIKNGERQLLTGLAGLEAAGRNLDAKKELLLERLEREGAFAPPDSSIQLYTPQGPGRGWRPWIVAASVILLVGVGVLLLQHTGPNPVPTPAVTAAPDVKAGGNKATLTLADGHRIVLDSSANGLLAAQSDMNVTKLSAGELSYNKATRSDGAPATVAYNSLSTPRTGQYTLHLPDGTDVWLNNASVIRYPVAFTGATRTVEMTGEAYFEIAKDPAHPFRVIVHRGSAAAAIASLASDAPPVADEGGAIEVLGTSFNVMAYPDEAAERTTLVDGSIRFTREGTGALLHPAEQSVLYANGALSVLPKVDIAEVIAWKNGFFQFDHASLETTMRQLARWYDIDVKYQGHLLDQQFVGRIQRSLPLSAVLKGLENDQIHFTLNGRELVVSP